jgi:hypothetical protein
LLNWVTNKIATERASGDSAENQQPRHEDVKLGVGLVRRRGVRNPDSPPFETIPDCKPRRNSLNSRKGKTAEIEQDRHSEQEYYPHR